MEEKQRQEIRGLSDIMLVVTEVVFSLIITAFTVLLEWDMWAIPLFAAAIAVTLFTHIARRPDYLTRIYVYSVILMLEMFYFTVKIDTVYDSAAVIIIVLIIIALTGERNLEWACIGVGYLGMIIHLIYTGGDGISFADVSDVVRTIWAFAVVLLAALAVGRLVIVVDRMRTAYQRRITELEDTAKSASDFLANVSHEIRTPINAVIGMAGVCIEKEEDEEIKEAMASVEEAGKRVAMQISDILDYSEIDVDNLAVNEEEYMMSSLLNDLVQQLKPIKDPGLELVIDVSPELPNVLYSDAGKIKKILWHLIANGLKYTVEGGVYVHIYSIEQSYGVNLCIEVEDTGVGMTPEELERVTERFFQANSGRNRSANGLGLGMSIVIGFVSALHGFVTIDSELGQGTRVHVSLPQKVLDPSECMSLRDRSSLALGAFLHFDKFPNANVREYYNSMLYDMVSGLKIYMHKVETIDNLRKLLSETKLTHLFVGEEEYMSDVAYMEELSKEMPVVVVADDDFELSETSHVRIMRKPFYCFPVIGILNAEPGRESEEEGKLTCPGVRALVVDDEPMNLTVATGILQRYGIIVSVAYSGPESIEMCRQNEYDIVFMDHMMPKMDGVEAMKHIRAINRDIPIVALTANAVSTAREMFLREGFDGFVSKPVELTELERVLKIVLPASSIVMVKEKREAGRPVRKKTPAKSATGFMGEIASLGIDTKAGLRYCGDDEGFYRDMLTEYVKDSTRKKKDLEGFLDSGDISSYTISVHGLKSTSGMIGAGDLAAKAKKLEAAGKTGDTEMITSETPEVMKEYVELVNGLGKILGVSPDEDDGDDDVMEFAPVTAGGDPS